MIRFPSGPNRLAVAGLAIIGLAMAGLIAAGTARAEDPASIDVTLKDHRFTPAEIHVQKGKRTDLHIRNEDNAAEEFDSSALKVEKVIPAGASAVVHLRPLGAGKYPFEGEFHPQTAKGVVIAE